MLNSSWINAASLNQAALGNLVPLASSFSASAALIGEVIRRAGLFSNAGAAAVGEGTLHVTVDLAGVASGTASASSLIIYTAALGSVFTATASLDGSSMAPIKSLASEFSGTATFFGDMSRDALYSNFSGEATLVGTIDPRRLLGGSVTASASFDPVDFTVYGHMGSSFAGTADFFGELSANSTISMSGVMLAEASLALSGTEWVEAPLAGVFGSSAGLVGEVVVNRRMPSGFADATAILEGALGRRARLDSAASAAATGVGGLVKRQDLNGIASAQAQGYGAVLRQAVFAGTAQATAALNSSSVWYVAAGAEASAGATGSGQLYASIFLAASASASAFAEGELLPNPGTIPPADRMISCVPDGNLVEALFESMTVQVM